MFPRQESGLQAQQAMVDAGKLLVDLPAKAIELLIDTDDPFGQNLYLPAEILDEHLELLAILRDPLIEERGELLALLGQKGPLHFGFAGEPRVLCLALLGEKRALCLALPGEERALCLAFLGEKRPLLPPLLGEE